MKKTLEKLRTSLIPIYGKSEAQAIIRLIFHYLKGWNLTDIMIHSQDELSPFMKNQIDEILQRLLKQEPVQYILGEDYWHGMRLKLRPGVLIPRPETSELVDIIIDDNKDREDLRILDVCTGSGCIALALARNLPFSKVTAIDFSEESMIVAKENSDMLHTKIQLIKEDIFNWKAVGSYDIIVSNPPYVMDSEATTMERNVLDYEPHEALFVRDEDPLVFYRRIASIALDILEKGGKLYFEINPLKADELKRMIEDMGFCEIVLLLDSFGKIRFLRCLKE